MGNKWYLLKYIGETFGIDELTNGKTYYAISDNEFMYRVIDDSGEDYLYSKENPAPTDGSSKGGKWEILETYETKDLDEKLLIVSDVDADVNNYKNSNYIKNEIFKSNYNEKVDDYLRTGKLIMMKSNIVNDIVDSDKGAIGTEIWYSDGKYKWSSFLIYMYEQYQIRIKDDFLNYIKVH